jgi:hypothetical protein
MGADSGETSSVVLTPKTINLIALTITFVWAVSFLADILLGDKYDPSPYVHLIMMALVGSVFTGNLLRRGSTNGD